jgi:hypothetical protein
MDCRTVVALGCPRPGALAPLQRDLELIALDRRDRIESIRRRLPDAQCVEWDPEGGDAPPLGAERLGGAIIVCDGLLESVTDPDALLACLRGLLSGAAAAIVVTPDRELVGDGDLIGEPAGRARWSAVELTALLELDRARAIRFERTRAIEPARGPGRHARQ